jgi:hypothetical protein
MAFAYASFGTPALPAWYSEFERQCYAAGQAWAQAGQEKLPTSVKVGDRDVPVVRSRHEFAKAFVAGWKSVRQRRGPGR